MQNIGDELFEKAKKILEEGVNLNEAENIFNKLLNENLYHQDSDKLIFYLASTYGRQGKEALSLILNHEVLRRNKNFMEARNNIGVIYKKQGKRKEAKECFEKVLETAKKEKYDLPASEEANYLSNLASTYIQNGTPQKAIEISNQALKLDQDDESAKWNRALAYLELGDYENGFPGLECGRKKERGAVKQYHENGTPFWDGTPGQTIVVYGEQGIGDEIMFASMLPDIMRDCRVILDAHTRLADLFRINYPDNPVYGTRETANIPWAKLHKNIDAKIEIGSLAKFYRKKESDFPKNTYLRADEKYVKKYWKKLDSMGNKPKIGISWKGGILATGAINRCIPLEMLKDILRMQEIDFISLQYNLDIYEKEVKPFEDKYHICLNHWQDAIDSYDETAGLVANLDLIISVPQSVVHLAGALGTMAWQLCPKKAMWQLGPYGKNPPWYCCVENIWQDDSDRWEPVIHQVKERLCNLLLTTTGN